MKLKTAVMKDVRVGYLYANQKLVLVHEASHKKAGKVEWATIHDTDVKCDFEGRLVLHRRGLVRLVLQAICIRAKAASLDGGSENTRKLGVAAGYVSVQLGPDRYNDAIHFNLLDGLISSDFSYQPELKWTEPEFPERWSDYRIAA